MQGPPIGRLDVRCIGASSYLDHCLGGGPTAAVALCHQRTPFLLVGCGGGVVQSCMRQLGTLPTSVFLPSVRLAVMQELQALVQHEATFQRRVRVFAAADVLDRAISLLDEEIVAEIKDFVEFLQVEPNVPTSVHTHYYFVMSPVNRDAVGAPRGHTGGRVALSAAYNLILLNLHQVPLLALLQGPTQRHNLEDETNVFFRQCPAAVATCWPFFEQRAAAACLGPSTRLRVIGYAADKPPPMEPPAAPLRAGDMFVVAADATDGGHASILDSNGDSAVEQPGTPPRGAAEDGDAFSPNDPPWLVRQQPPPRRVQQERHPRQAPEEPRPWVSFEEGGAWQDPPRGRVGVSTADYDGVTRRPPYPTSHLAADTPPPRPARAAAHRTASPGAGAGLRRGRSPSTGFTTFGGRPRECAPRGTLFSREVAAPRRLFVFSNEAKPNEPVVVVLTPAMTLGALKRKVSDVLRLRPMGQLYTVDGGLINDVSSLQHNQEVVATQHAGAPFDLASLPHKMRFTAPAVPEGGDGFEAHPRHRPMGTHADPYNPFGFDSDVGYH